MLSIIFRFSLTFSLLYNVTLFASSIYDEDTLKIFSKIIPRLVLMSNIKEQIDDEIRICILHDDIDNMVSLSLIDMVHNNYPNGIKNYKIKIINSNYKDIAKCTNTQLAFMLNSNEKNIENSLKFLYENSQLSMSYDSLLLEKGVEISLFFGRKITPYINLKAIRENGIELDNVLLRISKIYSKDLN